MDFHLGAKQFFFTRMNSQELDLTSEVSLLVQSLWTNFLHSHMQGQHCQYTNTVYSIYLLFATYLQCRSPIVYLPET